MRHATFRQKMRYRFDNLMSRGAVALIGWLGLLSALMIAIVAAIVYFASLAPPESENGPAPGPGTILWQALMHSIDAGTVAGDAGSPTYLAIMLACTAGGIFIVSILIGLLTTGIESKLDDLRKGRSLVVEEGHTVILGWSSQIFTIVSELIEANASRGRACIAILADKDKVEMDDELNARIPERRGTHIVCRSGNPLDIADLDIVNPQTSRAIIVLAPEDTDNPDTYVIKALLALVNGPNRREEPYHIVAQIQDERNLSVAKMVGRDECELILTRDAISRIAIQTCRQSGLSVVYTELMDFGGDEMYFHEEPALTGKPFSETLFCYAKSAVIGLRAKNGEIILNPPSDRVIAAGDKLIVIAEDDDKIVLTPSGANKVDESAIRTGEARTPKPERTLVLGWNHNVPLMLRELNEYVAAGSEVTVVAGSAEVGKHIEAQQPALGHLALTFIEGDTNDRKLLDDLKVWTFDHILTVAYADGMSTAEADAQTLITLLHLRDISTIEGKDLSVVSEMLDPRNRDLAEVTQADDFIVSDRLISLLMSQISENKELFNVFADLFRSEGSEIYVRPAPDYVEPGKPVNFYTVTEAARRRGQIAIGYRIAADAHDAAAAYGVAVNPEKGDKITFTEDDAIVVLSED